MFDKLGSRRIRRRPGTRSPRWSRGKRGGSREFDWDEAMATRQFLGQVLTAVHDAREDQGEALDDLRDAMDWIENHPEMSEDEDLSLDSNGGA
jgi:hypothetical protein